MALYHPALNWGLASTKACSRTEVSYSFQISCYAYFDWSWEAYLVRVGVGSLTMFFQQWTGINAVLYVSLLHTTEVTSC